MAHDYELKSPRNYSKFGSPIWEEKPPYKKVRLINPLECKDKITVSSVRSSLMGSGWFEWEDLLAFTLVKAIVEAIDKDTCEADITQLFSCELHGEDWFGSFSMPQDEVIDLLMGRLFECVEETDDILRVRIIKKAIS